MISSGSFVCSLLMAYDRRCVLGDGLGCVAPVRRVAVDGPTSECAAETGQLGPTALGSLLAVRMIIFQASDCTSCEFKPGLSDT